jgi:hypothetical protein
MTLTALEKYPSTNYIIKRVGINASRDSEVGLGVIWHRGTEKPYVSQAQGTGSVEHLHKTSEEVDLAKSPCSDKCDLGLNEVGRDPGRLLELGVSTTLGREAGWFCRLLSWQDASYAKGKGIGQPYFGRKPAGSSAS